MARRIRLFIFFAILLQVSCSPEGGYELQDGETEQPFPPNALCIEAGRRQQGDPVTLLPENGRNECIEAEGPFIYHLRGNETKIFRIYGIPHAEYCVGVKRTYGYITISREHGSLAREGDSFTWCIVPQAEERESITVRPLTARASFELLLP